MTGSSKGAVSCQKLRVQLKKNSFEGAVGRVLETEVYGG
jgi:hypothetical protein